MTSFDRGAVVEYWTKRIQRDVTPFIDPGTELTLEASGRAINANWQQRGKSREAVFVVSPEGVEVRIANQQWPYRSFFASDGMADLLSLAKMTLQARRIPSFVSTRAIRTGVAGAVAEPATELLKQVVRDASTDDATVVVMVTGEAGAGKTSVLQELVREQADDYLSGRANQLFLYVNAQGRALARFNEALATELQDLRATLTYHAVSTLVRLGLLVPVIDGFDELLGVAGYDDAFSSLSLFIAELDGEGQLIASARSTYYEQEFVARANRVSSLGAQVWRQVPIEVAAWGDEELGKYIDIRSSLARLSGDDTVQLHNKVERIFKGANQTLRSKPFFVARAIDLVLAGVDLSGTRDLLEELVQAFIDRERNEKLLTKTGIPILSADSLRCLIRDLAEEMWNQETRELDRLSAEEIAELAMLDVRLAPEDRNIVIKRMPNMAFFMPGEKPGNVKFEHETFFAYFLGQKFADKLASADGIPPILLGRSVLPEEVAAIAVRAIFDDEKPPEVSSLLEKLSSVAQGHSSRSAQVRENAGLLGATVLREGCGRHTVECTGLRMTSLVIPGGSLRGVKVTNASLEYVEFRRTDLSDAQFLKCHALGVVLHEVLIDPQHTRLEFEGLNVAEGVVGLRVTDNNDIRVVYDPTETYQLLTEIGAAKPLPGLAIPRRNVDGEIMELLQRFVRAFNRANPVCTADDAMRSVFSHPNWKDLEKLLRDSAVVTFETRPTKGQHKQFLRRQVLAEEIMAGAHPDAPVPDSVRDFWSALERRFPAE